MMRLDPAGDDRLHEAARQVGPDRIGVIPFVGEQRLGPALGQGHEHAVGTAVGRLAARQVERDQSSPGVGDAVKLTGPPAPRAAKSLSTAPFLAPAADTWARTVVLSMLWWAASPITSARPVDTASHTPDAFRRRETAVDRVPVAKALGQVAPVSARP